MKYWKIGLGLALMLVFFCCGTMAGSVPDSRPWLQFALYRLDDNLCHGTVEVKIGDDTTTFGDSYPNDYFQFEANKELSLKFFPESGYQLKNGSITSPGQVAPSYWNGPETLNEHVPIDRSDTTSFPMNGNSIVAVENNTYSFQIQFEPIPAPPPPVATYQVTTEYDPSTGAVTGAGMYAEGANVVCGFTPKDGYYLSGESSYSYGGTTVAIPEGSASVSFTMPAETVTVNAVFKPWDGLIDLGVSGAVIRSNELVYNGSTFPLAGLNLRVRGNTSGNTLNVTSGKHTLLLQSVSVYSNIIPPFSLSGGSDVTLLLAQGSKNAFEENDIYDGISLQNNAKLTIECAVNKPSHVCDEDCGFLAVHGNNYGIAGGSGSLSIAGGRVEVSGGYNGRGILINSMSVTGGIVSAQSGGTGIEAENNLSISGGTIEASSINSTNGAITITGGSVNAAMYKRPVNASAVPVYRVKAKLDGAGAVPVKGITATSGGVKLKYGMNDVRADKDGNIYLYLPLGARLTEAASGGDLYEGSISALSDDSASGTLEKDLRKLKINEAEFGKAATSDVKSVYAAGKSVTLIFTPDEYKKGVVPAYVQKGSYYEYTLNGKAEKVEIPELVDEYTFKMPDADVVVTPAFEEGEAFDGIIDLSVSGAVLNNGTIEYAGEVYPLTSDVKLTATGTTKVNNIVVESGSHTLYLNGASADVSDVDGARGIEIKSGASLDLRMNPGTRNTFGGGIKAAGIGAGEGATLIIGCAGGSSHNHICGELTATGGYNGAGIGGGFGGRGGTITIKSSTVTATGGWYSAGIGGGNLGDGGSITITGGTVTAVGHGEELSGLDGIKSYAGAGLGGGESGNGGTIKITGGTVTANGGGYGSADIGIGKNGSGGNITITGGSINATNMGTQPVNAAGANVYRMAVNLDIKKSNAKITKLPLMTGANNYKYGINDVKTDDNGYLYIYAPDKTTLAKIGLFAEGKYYSATGTIAAATDDRASATFKLSEDVSHKNPIIIVNPDGLVIPSNDLPNDIGAAGGGSTVILSRDVTLATSLTVPPNVYGGGEGKLILSRGGSSRAGSPRSKSDAPGVTFEGETSGWKFKNPAFVDVSAFLPGDSGKGIIATLYFDKYVVGSQVLTGVMDGSGIHKRFVIGNGKTYALDELGRLVKKAKQFGDFVFVIDELVLQPGMKAKVANLLPPDFVGDVKWASSDADVLGVQKKKTLNAVAVGSATLTATRSDGAQIDLPVRVVEKGTVVKTISLPKKTSLAIGEKTRLTPKLKPDTALETALFWLSSDECVATVDDGYVSALRAGKAKIYAFSSSGRRAATTITVKSSKLESWALSDAELTLAVGELRRLIATVTPSEADQSVKWKSNKPKIASVSDGIVLAQKPGKATITCTFANGKKLKCVVTVE